jgi:cytochrome c biogenesis protein CcmG, thiol:disulfide interchange protein DsbE
MRRPAALALVAVVAGGLVVAEVLSGSSGGKGERRTPPALPTAVMSGAPVDLAALRGRPAVVNFWASWCGPCKREAPELQRLSATLAGRARLVGVDRNDGLGGARAFVRRYDWRFSILRDPDGAVGNRWGLTGLPTTFVLDRDGRIAATLRGPQTAAKVEQEVRRLS